MIDVIAGSVKSAGISHSERLREADGHPTEIGALGFGPRPRQRFGERSFGKKHRALRGVQRIGRAGLLDDAIAAIHLVVPGTTVPVVVADEVEDAGRFDVQRDIEIVGLLIQEVGSVGALVAAAPVVGAAHVGPGADALIGPPLPLAIGVGANGDRRRLGSGGRGQAEEANDPFHFEKQSTPCR